MVNQDGVAQGQYLRFTDAYNDSTSGDTIFMYPGQYGSILIEKDLTVIGSGFHLTNNYTGQPNLLAETEVNGLSIRDAMDVEIIGLKIGSVGVSSCDKVVVESCSIFSGVSIYNCGEVSIIKNRIHYPNTTIPWLSSNSNVRAHIVAYANKYVVIRNNIFDDSGSNILNHTFATPPSGIAYPPNHHEFFLYNTSPTGRPDLSKATIKGNIFESAVLSAAHCGVNDITNNINTLSTVYCEGTTNMYVLPSNIFIDYDAIAMQNINAPDSAFLLAPTSPAIGAGPNGTDCGAFGGDDPYVLSGTPGGPFIHHFDVTNSTAPNTGVNVMTKVKAID